MRSTSLGRAAARAVPCPHCSAAIGADCAQDETAELCGLHVARLLLAERERSALQDGHHPYGYRPVLVEDTLRPRRSLLRVLLLILGALGALLAWWAGRTR